MPGVLLLIQSGNLACEFADFIDAPDGGHEFQLGHAGRAELDGGATYGYILQGCGKARYDWSALVIVMRLRWMLVAQRQRSGG